MQIDASDKEVRDPPQGGSTPAPCPRWASNEEREAWLNSLTMEQQIERGDLDPTAHDYSEVELELAARRRAIREEREGTGDPFHYQEDRKGRWPRVDTIGEPRLSNTWRTDDSGGWTPGGFPWNGMRQVSHRELVEERIPRRCKKPEQRAKWLAEAINRERMELVRELRLVLAERHGRMRAGEDNAPRLAMAWNHVAANRASLAALRELEKEARRELEKGNPQLSLF